MKPAIIPAILLALLCALAVPPRPAVAAVGKMTVEKGPVKVRHSGTSQIYTTAGQTIPLEAGDSLHAGDGASAIIVFGDGDEQMRLYPNSHFVMNEVTDSRSRFGLTIGKVFVGVLARLRANRVTVQTPTAVIGVKGTEFLAGTDGDRTYLLTLNGAVSFVNNVLPDVEETLRADQASFTARFQPPTPATDVTPAQRDQIVAGPSLAPFENVSYQGDVGAKAGQERGLDAIEQTTSQTAELGGVGGTGSLLFLPYIQ